MAAGEYQAWTESHAMRADQKPAGRRLLIVDDDPGMLRALRWAFTDVEVETAQSRAEALEKLETWKPQVVTLDLGLPPAPDDPSEGFVALREILTAAPRTKVIVISGQNERENAVRAIGLGAHDFYEKPVEPELLTLFVDRAFNVAELEAENRRLQAGETSGFAGIVTGSKKMQALFRTIEKVATSAIGVLLLGESGTGKELFARALHRSSGRASRPFVAINCGAIPETLLESELFGHEKGAFTGAVRQVKGKIETAHGGTLFLDEIGDMPLQLQVKLLRFLQERVIERIGGRESIPVDVRIVCATHRNIETLVGEGAFREDLYFRISEMVLEIPPLRERGDDAVLLAKYFAERMAREEGLPRLGLSADAEDAIRAYAWPGNVRELENRVKRAAILADADAITAVELQLDTAAVRRGRLLSLREAREAAERSAVTRALEEAGNNLSQAAKILGVSRPTVYNLLRQLDIKVP